MHAQGVNAHAYVCTCAHVFTFCVIVYMFGIGSSKINKDLSFCCVVICKIILAIFNIDICPALMKLAPYLSD